MNVTKFAWFELITEREGNTRVEIPIISDDQALLSDPDRAGKLRVKERQLAGPYQVDIPIPDDIRLQVPPPITATVSAPSPLPDPDPPGGSGGPEQPRGGQ